MQQDPNVRQEALNQIKNWLEDKIITPKDLQPFVPKNSINFNLRSIFGYIGGLILLLGLIYLIGQNWRALGDAGQVMVTFGAGITGFFWAVLLNINNKERNLLTDVTYLISAALIPTGITVLVSKIPNTTIDQQLFFSLLSTGMFVMYLITRYVFRRNSLNLITALFGIISVAGWYGLLTRDIVAWTNFWRFGAVAALCVGLSLLLASFLLWSSENQRLSARLFAIFGSLTVWISAFSLIYYINPSDFGPQTYSSSRILEYIFGLIFIPFFLIANRINSGIILTLTSLGTLFWINYLNLRYFSNLVSFPIALIISGTTILVASLFIPGLYRRFIKKESLVSITE